MLVPIGTTIKDVLEFAGGVSDTAAEIMMGGPMMGIDVCSTDAVIEKRNNAIIVMEERTASDTTPCIHCDRCAGACPMRLYPANVEAALDSKLYDRLDDLNVNYCMECGSCAFVCPAHRPLTQSMRLAKAELRRRNGCILPAYKKTRYYTQHYVGCGNSLGACRHLRLYSFWAARPCGFNNKR